MRTRPNAELPRSGPAKSSSPPQRGSICTWWMPRRKTSSFSYSILFRLRRWRSWPAELVAFLRLDHEAVESGHQVGREFGRRRAPTISPPPPHRLDMSSSAGEAARHALAPPFPRGRPQPAQLGIDAARLDMEVAPCGRLFRLPG